MNEQSNITPAQARLRDEITTRVERVVTAQSKTLRAEISKLYTTMIIEAGVLALFAVAMVVIVVTGG